MFFMFFEFSDKDSCVSKILEEFRGVWSSGRSKNGIREAHSFVLKRPGGHFSHSNDLQRG